MEPARGKSCLSGHRRPRHTWGGKGLILGSETFSYLYNSIIPGTEMQIPLVDTAPQVVQTPTQLPGCSSAEAHRNRASRELPLGTTSRSRHTRGGYNLFPGLKYFHSIFTFNNPGMKSQIPRVNTAPQGLETPTQLAICY